MSQVLIKSILLIPKTATYISSIKSKNTRNLYNNDIVNSFLELKDLLKLSKSKLNEFDEICLKYLKVNESLLNEFDKECQKYLTVINA